MRLCRYQHNGNVEAAFYLDDAVVNIHKLAAELGVKLPRIDSGNLSHYVRDNLLQYLPPEGRDAQTVAELWTKYEKLPVGEQARFRVAMESVRLRVPIPDMKKAILLAGNYAEHVREGGGEAAERQDTFPYFFWKPPSTTLTHPGDPIRVPKVSPHHVDWELELGVLIGRRTRDVSEKDALGSVAGYTVCNDVSDRKFQINPNRKPRERDRFHDWLHGKWHDTFLPMGPCIRSAASVPNPQQFPMKLRVNGQVMQDANTSQMIFPVAALVSILSSFTTLEPGDVIVTGTPAGVGHSRKPPVYLKSGDQVEAEIAGIGVLRNPVA
jgi:2-keto-4-pentenoate hydratase/2-oxohepta-3-ene-1,7-dioic acid hydratase in catechol pathway